MNKKLLILLAVLVPVAVLVFWMTRPAPVVVLKESSPEVAAEAVSLTRQAFEAFSTGKNDRERRQFFAPLDADLTAKLEEKLRQISEPDFSRARVTMAEGDANTCCVDIPAAGGKKVRFIVERHKGRLGLAACGDAV